MANRINWRGQTEFTTGDTVRVHQTIQEGSKTRTQIFEGIVIRIKGHFGLKAFTVRKIASNSIGVEKIFPENSPTVTKIDIKKRGKVRRAVLTYLRSRIGRKATRIKDVFVKGAGKLDEKTETVTKTETVERPDKEEVSKNKIGRDADMEAKKAARKERQSKKKKKIEKKEKVFVR